MKVLFFLLLTANIGLFMWEYKTGALLSGQNKAEQIKPAIQEPIRLVSELDNVPPPTPTQSTPEPAPALPPAENNATAQADKPAEQPGQNDNETIWHCYEAGPFTSQKSFQNWKNQLAGINSEIQLISKDEQVANKYMVYYPATTPGETQANVQMLKNQGIKDILVMTDKEQNGQISLGIFSREERALTLQAKLLGKGIKTQIKPLYKNVKQKYARIKSNIKIIGDFDILTKTYPQFTVKPIATPTEDCL